MYWREGLRDFLAADFLVADFLGFDLDFMIPWVSSLKGLVSAFVFYPALACWASECCRFAASCLTVTQWTLPA